MKLLYCMLSLSMLHICGIAQTNTTFFQDTLTRVSKQGKITSGFYEDGFFYLSGGGFNSTVPMPVVSKVDTLGHVIWTAADNEPFNNEWYYFTACENTFKDGEQIYTVARRDQDYGDLYQIWCLSDSSGTILWKTQFKVKLASIADYSETELIAISAGTKYQYYIISKLTGEIQYSTTFATAALNPDNRPTILVDSEKNILLTWSDSCRKFSDKYLTNTLWTTVSPEYLGRQRITTMIEDAKKILVVGLNHVKAIDKTTGNILWHTKTYPPDDDGIPAKCILKEGILFITWTSIYSAPPLLENGFSLTAIHTSNGETKYNVAYDFNGIPYAPPTSSAEIDRPKQMCMDENGMIYMTGFYDHEWAGNWGIMKLDSRNGEKIYEATITDDSTKRYAASDGNFIFYKDGKVYNAGNLQIKNTYDATKPLFVAFDTGNVYKEKFRNELDFSFRYPSKLVSVVPIDNHKMVLFKKLGKSSVIELRSVNGRLFWSDTFSIPGKFVEPQHFAKISDSLLAASMTVYLPSTYYGIYQGQQDSIIFITIDLKGNIQYKHSVGCLPGDSAYAVQVYSDKNAVTNFFFGIKKGSVLSYKGYTLYTPYPKLATIGGEENYDGDQAMLQTEFAQLYGGDTIVYYQAPDYINYRLCVSQQNADWYKNYGYDVQFLKGYSRIHSLLKVDSGSYIIMGKDSSNRPKMSKINHGRSNPWLWNYNPSTNGTIYHADTSVSSLYAVSKQSVSNDLLVLKIDRQTGKQQWAFKKTPKPHSDIIPTSIQLNKSRDLFTVGGFTVDTVYNATRIGNFMVVIDTFGNVVKEESKIGTGQRKSDVSALASFSDGTQIYGGSADSYGFYNTYTFEKNVFKTHICVNESLSLAAANTGSNYQWQIDSGRGYSNIINSNDYTGATAQSLTITKISSSYRGYKYRCLVDGIAETPIEILFENIWNGTGDFDWQNPLNWSCGKIPDENTDVIIEAGNVVITSTVYCRSLQLGPGVNVTISQGAEIIITH